jgi:hypothetical protein
LAKRSNNFSASAFQLVDTFQTLGNPFESVEMKSTSRCSDAVSRSIVSNIQMLCLFMLFIAVCSCTADATSFLRQQSEEIQFDRRSLSSPKSSKRSFNYSLADWHDDSKGKSGDEYGGALAVQNNVAIVASPAQSDYPLYEVSDGKVFIFVDVTGTNDWELIREVTGEDATEFFGSSVALHADSSGTYLAVVGAPRGNRYGQFSGGVYYFNVQADSTKDQDYPTHLVQKERHGGAQFGSSVAITEINGQVMVAVGATGHRGRGAVFVYTRAKDGSLGNEVILYGSVAKGGAQFGYSVAFNDDMVAVGAPAVSHGMVFLYAHTSSGSFEEVKYMAAPAASDTDMGNDDNSGNNVYHYFGGSIAVGNGFLFVGSPLNNLRGQNSGSVYVYDLTDVYNPSFVQTLFPGSNDAAGMEFGWSMSFDTRYKKLIVGSSNRESTSVSGGKASIYTERGDGYLLEVTLHANKFIVERVGTESKHSLFGKGVAVHGDYAVVGAPFGNGAQSSSGDVYFYKAQSKKEFYSSDSSDDGTSLGMFDFSNTSVQLSLIAGVFLLVLVLLYRRYSAHGDEEGFGNFLSTGCVTDEDGERSFDEDSSAHSNHPMIVKSSKEGKKGKGKKGVKASVSKKSSKLGKAGARTAYSSIHDEDL